MNSVSEDATDALLTGPEQARVVHELNNALTAVLANAQLILAGLEGGAFDEELADVIEGARRATALARRLRQSAQALQAEEAS